MILTFITNRVKLFLRDEGFDQSQERFPHTKTEMCIRRTLEHLWLFSFILSNNGVLWNWISLSTSLEKYFYNFIYHWI